MVNQIKGNMLELCYSGSFWIEEHQGVNGSHEDPFGIVFLEFYVLFPLSASPLFMLSTVFLKVSFETFKISR